MAAIVTTTLRGIDPSPALEAAIRQQVDGLETYNGTIVACRVLVELGHRHETGNRYNVRIEVSVPGDEIVVTHRAGLHGHALDADTSSVRKDDETDPERKHAYVALREAFDAARRQLQDYSRRQRGFVKVSARQPHGRVARLFPVDEYGFIETEDGREVYFHKHAVLKDGFDRLAVGSVVSFAEEPGDKGPQASTVKLVRSARSH